MIYDGSFTLALGMSAKSKLWKNKVFSWSELVDKLEKGLKTNETYKEFINASKEDQSRVKDIGGYVGGYLRNGRRKPENVVNRQLLTLDIDFATKDFWDDFTLQFDNAAVLHSTHKHCDANPRYRLVMPLSRECSPDEYEATARQVAGLLGIDLFDNTTFEVNRLMFWPSTPKDSTYSFEFQDGAWIDVDEVLGYYIDWTDTSLWPTADKNFQDVKTAVRKQEDPRTKKGIIGAFCRSYSISEAIETFLSDEYTPTTFGDRYSYSKGTTSAGLIVYDDTFAYSHHGTDPCSGKLCNAFDLVRTHKFGHLDSDESYSGSKPKSTLAMEEFCQKDKGTKDTIAKEIISEAKYDFVEEYPYGEEDCEELEELDLEWMQNLSVDAKGCYLSTAPNINMILANDQRFKGLFKRNDFDGKSYIFGSMPWRRLKYPEAIRNVDYCGIRNYIETVYGISGTLKIDDSVTLEFERNHYHPIKDYLNSLEWDGTERLDTLLVDYFGTEDSLYTREAIRKVLVGAVARVFEPGIKFDLVLTLIGGQGVGKSTFVKKLGKQWHSDTFFTVQGKEALEQIQGCWIIEMAELAGLKKAEVESVKHFISKQEDTFRPAYGRTSETYPRQCIFIGTANNRHFLRDPTGNRRFLPVDTNTEFATKSIFTDLDAEVDQIWAEATTLYRNGEKPFLSAAATNLAKQEQKDHCETDDRTGIIEEYLDMLLPEDWNSKDIFERKAYLSDPLSAKGTIERDYVCIAEVWCECLGQKKEDMDRYKTRDINEILRSLENWEQSKSTKNFALYGKQKYYSRKID